MKNFCASLREMATSLWRNRELTIALIKWEVL